MLSAEYDTCSGRTLLEHVKKEGKEIYTRLENPSGYLGFKDLPFLDRF
jgi:hypothetical protein